MNQHSSEQAPPIDEGQLPSESLLARLGSTMQGLSPDEAAARLRQTRVNSHRVPRWYPPLLLLLGQFRSPITLILIGAAILSYFLRDPTDATIILVIVGVSALLGFWQEYLASQAVAELLALIATQVTVRRDGQEIAVPANQVVAGDILILSAGDMLPGDCRLLEGRDLFVNEAALTGETFPVEKQPGSVPVTAPLARRTNYLFQGSSVASGQGVTVVVTTGNKTELGRISGRLRLRPPETDFERGVRRFGNLLLEITLLLLVLTFAIHVYLHRPVLETFLFALALAVGLTPQLLPAIISVTLSFGAKRLADCEVVVRRLASIENFGSMNVLCSDKTGTLTEGIIQVEAAIDPSGQPSQEVLQLAFVNASFETGFANPLDEAVRNAGKVSLSLDGWTKQDEIPYDFLRKRITVLVESPMGRQLITKGAVAQVLDCCSSVAHSQEEIVSLEKQREEIERRFAKLSEQGFRLLAVATKPQTRPGAITRDDERDMVFRGFLVLRDPPRKDAADTLTELRSLGITLKMITGDNRHVAGHIAESIGWPNVRVLTGEEMRRLSNEALRWRAERTDVFAEIEPNQKEHIIRALQRGGYVVGYIGDGINDATALHVADVGISVASAVDVAKETADIVLLRPDLQVLLEGVRQGRETFANTLKYVYLATSANLGNMLSMAVASVFLPFLPLLPRQVLLTNLLTDLPEMMIAHDRVDPEQVERPQRWDLRRIQRFMLVFGPLSSLFDMLTFATLIVLFHADETTFRTAWFVESVVSACVIVLVMRTRRPFWRSRPAWALSLANLGVIATTLALPYTPLAEWLAFSWLSGSVLSTMLAIAFLYVAAAESAKRFFFRFA